MARDNSEINAIAQGVIESGKAITLIYAFNGTGKTRLSVAYKDVTKENNDNAHAGVYYNAYSEDLFLWNNDEEHNNENIRLEITPSKLNQFHTLISEDFLIEKLDFYYPKYKFDLNFHDDQEQGIDNITFYLDEETKEPIKISRGEERIFVWCFFLALFDVDTWTDEQSGHIFIDDPVSSLDDHNIFITADSLFKIIEENYSEKKVVITTHHIGLFSILADRLTKGGKADRYKKITDIKILNSKNNNASLDAPRGNVFLFHLHLLQTLDKAIIDEKLFAYHFVLLRQLLEHISSFLGIGGINYALSQIGITNIERVANDINSLSHKDTYRPQFAEMSPTEVDMLKDVFDKIKIKYKFKF